MATSLLSVGPAMAQAQAPAALRLTLDAQMMQDAEQLSAAGKHADAAAKYEELVKKFPQVPSVPEANFRAGYAHFLAGEYDPALAAFKRVLDTKNLPPELAQLSELSMSMTPQVLAAKAGKLPPEDPKRKAALEEAVKEFDAYLAKYPNSDEAESATYGKGLALFQLGKYDDAIAALRGNPQCHSSPKAPRCRTASTCSRSCWPRWAETRSKKPAAPAQGADAAVRRSGKSAPRHRQQTTEFLR